MKHRLYILIIFILVAVAPPAFAEGCPHCGQEYDDECAPGDEGYISSIRAAHEAECAARYESSSSVDTGGGYGQGAGYGGYDASRQRQAEEQRLLRQQQEELMRRRQEEARRRREEEARRLEKERKGKVEFQKNKTELVSSLKGASAGGLKGVGAASGLGLKGLKIREVPSPLATKSAVPEMKLKLKSMGGTDTHPRKEKGVVTKALVKSYEKTRQGLIDWTYTETFKITFGRIPGASYAKALYGKYKNMRDKMKSLNMNIFQYAMKGIKDGTKRLASPSLSDGGLADEYEEGRENLFSRTSTKVKKWLKKEIDK